ncbi:transcriptional regulator GcvA [Rhodospirillaceae bacterium SYSU D60014]|uniref:transcriptional regulator GcvA n=1 Tax=Virgifigura deserti TaxID=2268457 RepID=UPI000E672882
MARRLPSLNALRAFEAVSRHGSIRAAADELHVTPAAVSQQVKALEEGLGVKLLRRAEGGLRLTEAGASGLEDLRAGFDRLSQAARKMRASNARLLTVSVDPSLAATWLIARLDRFKQRHPEIDVFLDASSAHVDLTREEIDMAIRYGAGDFPGLHAVRLFEDEVFPVCSPALLEGEHPLREPADLRWHRLLHLEWTPAKGEWPDWRSWLSAAGVESVDVTRGPRFTQHSMVLQAAVQGQGVALGSRALVADDLAAGRLVWPFDLCVPTSFAYYIVCLEAAAEDPRIAAFRDWLLAEAGCELSNARDGEV